MIIAIAVLACAAPINLRTSTRSASTPPSSVSGELGHEAAKMDEAQLRLRPGDLEGEPPQREREHVLADNLRDEGQPVKTKAAHLEREEGIGFFFHR